METWSTHHLSQEAEVLLGKESALKLTRYSNKLKRNDLPVIFTLRHLSKIVKVDYKLLRSTVNRQRESANYRMFAIKKRSGGRRHIHAVTGELFKVQHFINSEILQKIKPHNLSFAFHTNGGIRKCAEMHCGARWLFQFDIENFFYSINESDVYKIFLAAGYRSLLSFELARICTTLCLPAHLASLIQRNAHSRKKYKLYNPNKNCSSSFFDEYRPKPMGVLPQGAPSSPMISNLVAKELDISMEEYADKNGLIYTRYADDITLSSSSDLPKGVSTGKIRRDIIEIIRKNHFKENRNKTRIAGPGSKKIVLGLLVDSERPRLSKETYKRITRHIYAIEKFGIEEVAKYEKFDSALGFYNHICGLISFVKDVDRERWNDFHKKISKITPPTN